MRSLLDITTIVCIGLLVGTEFAVSAFINPILRKLGTREELRAIRLFAGRLGFVMPFWYGGSLVLLIAEMAIRRGDTGGALLIASSAIWAAVIILTLLFLVPINNRLAQLDPETASESELREHGHWDGMHRWRVAALTMAMVCFLLAVVHIG
ncbi:MAG TPA: DUF1772 domain-containing protein [Terracidiphilus sp.]|jgi:uncharacterized membrane protein